MSVWLPLVTAPGGGGFSNVPRIPGAKTRPERPGSRSSRVLGKNRTAAGWFSSCCLSWPGHFCWKCPVGGLAPFDPFGKGARWLGSPIACREDPQQQVPWIGRGGSSRENPHSRRLVQLTVAGISGPAPCCSCGAELRCSGPVSSASAENPARPARAGRVQRPASRSPD